MEVLTERGIVPGIKVDRSTTPLAGSPDERITEGLDGLRERLVEYRKLGARFAKWRGVITIGDGRPTSYAIDTNAHTLARYAALCQESGLVPIVEPEVLMDGDHSLERAFDVTETTLERVFTALRDQSVVLEHMLLKPSMVLPGASSAEKATTEEVAVRRWPSSCTHFNRPVVRSCSAARGSDKTMLRSLKDLERYSVSATDGEVGSVVDFLLDDERWVIRYLVVETGDILGGERGLISPISFREADWSTRRFHLALTMDKVRNSPSVDVDKPVSRQHERDYFRYYEYPYYWEGSELWGMGVYPGLLPGAGWDEAPVEQSDKPAGDVHLRSAAEVRGYHIQGSDDAIGHVADFIVDDETWGISYLVVDTSNWWFGKKVLVAPHWASRISWEERMVYVDVTREAIRKSPEWNAADGINHRYEERLYDYYGRPAPRRIADLPGDQMTHSDDKNPIGKSNIASDDAATEGDSAEDGADAIEPNPPHTTSLGWLTVPKFGSASSGGGEIEPGPERD